jgi:ABC-type phosphate transport system ATPase subunit
LLTLAQTLEVELDILLMNEPTSPLDPKSMAAIKNLVISLRIRHTILWITHQYDQAQFISDRILILEEGKVLKPDGLTTEAKKAASFKNILHGA